MCIRDSTIAVLVIVGVLLAAAIFTISRTTNSSEPAAYLTDCLLYTSDAADERSSVDLGGRRIIKKKNLKKTQRHTIPQK